ncbi:hypothetical protein [Pirellulimonas nuda]|nr:hypothetical protein [Pirellulimonas nuda]
MIDYSNTDFSYEADRAGFRNEREEPSRTSYSRSRATSSARRTPRRRSPKSPGCGIGARRNRRWAW